MTTTELVADLRCVSCERHLAVDFYVDPGDGAAFGLCQLCAEVMPVTWAPGWPSNRPIIGPSDLVE